MARMDAAARSPAGKSVERVAGGLWAKESGSPLVTIGFDDPPARFRVFASGTSTDNSHAANGDLLHADALGLSWGRPRLAMPDKVDPEKAAKQWAIAQAVVEAGPEATVLYADESRIQLLPLLRAMWHWVGE